MQCISHALFFYLSVCCVRYNSVSHGNCSSCVRIHVEKQGIITNKYAFIRYKRKKENKIWNIFTSKMEIWSYSDIVMYFLIFCKTVKKKFEYFFNSKFPSLWMFKIKFYFIIILRLFISKILTWMPMILNLIILCWIFSCNILKDKWKSKRRDAKAFRRKLCRRLSKQH